MSRASLASALAAGLLLSAACRSATARRPPEPEPTPPPPSEEPLPVKRVDIDIIVAAWAEPSHLPYGGGDAQILVRVQKRGNVPVPGVEVRLATSQGSLFSAGHVLLTDARGMTRDRLSVRRTANVVLNAGGTRYSFRVPVDVKPE